jgi:tetratricopeptide (TPR) repeat protein
MGSSRSTGAVRVCLLAGIFAEHPHIERWLPALDNTLRARGMRLVLATVGPNPFAEIPSITLPSNFYDHAARPCAVHLPGGAQWSRPLVERLAAWGSAPIETETARRALSGCAALAASLADQLAPEAVLLWCFTSPQSRVFKRVFDDRCIPTWYLERGFFPDTLMLEQAGHAALSELHAGFAASHAAHETGSDTGAFDALREHVTRWAPPKHAQAAAVSAADLRNRWAGESDRLVLFLGQSDRSSGLIPGTAAERRRHSPDFASTADALDHVILASRAIGNCRVVFKPHPYAGAEDAPVRPDVIMARDVHLHSAIEAADLVVGQVTTALFDALLFDKPIVSLGRSVLSGRGISYDCPSRDQLGSTMNAAIQRRGFDARMARSRAFIGWLARHFLIAGSGDVPAVRPLDDLSEFIAENALPPEDRPVELRLSDLNQLSGSATGTGGPIRPIGGAEDASVLVSAAVALRRCGQLREARALAIHVLMTMSPDDRSEHWTVLTYIVGATSRELGLWREAFEAFELLASASGDGLSPQYHGGALFHLAALHETLGEVESARLCFTRCLAVLPSHRRAVEGLARIDQVTRSRFRLS